MSLRSQNQSLEFALDNLRALATSYDPEGATKLTSNTSGHTLVAHIVGGISRNALETYTDYHGRALTKKETIVLVGSIELLVYNLSDGVDDIKTWWATAHKVAKMVGMDQFLGSLRPPFTPATDFFHRALEDEAWRDWTHSLKSGVSAMLNFEAAHEAEQHRMVKHLQLGLKNAETWTIPKNNPAILA